MGRKRQTDLSVFRGQEAFAVQPGNHFSDVVTFVGGPQMVFGDPDLYPEEGGALGPTFDEAESKFQWLRATYNIDVPQSTPFGGGILLSSSFNLWFRYRSDTLLVWAIGVSDETGTFERTIGGVSPVATLGDVSQLLGTGYRTQFPLPALRRCIWSNDASVYDVTFLAQTVRGLRERKRGEQDKLEVLSMALAPQEYLVKLIPT